jgi:glycosyltransferase involved in cell wall biosynthesis
MLYFRTLKPLAPSIHINNVGCEVAAIAAKLAGFRHVIGTVHNLPGRDREARRFARRLVERMSLHCCDHLIFPSQYCREQWQQRCRLTPSNAVIYHGCRTGIVDPALSKVVAIQRLKIKHTGAETLLIGVAGRLHQCKGHDVLFRALGRILNVADVIVLVAGDGPIVQQLHQLSRQLSIEDKVQFMGRCDDMASFYRAIDINVLPSYSEGLGLSVVEAMHAGLPQVVSDAGGMAELVRDSGAGLVFPSGQSEALADAVVTMCKNGDMRAEYGKMAKSYAEVNLTKSRMLDETLAFYERCLDVKMDVAN